jgi:hypothetical protein
MALQSAREGASDGGGAAAAPVVVPSVERRPGNHLTPVVLRLSGGDLSAQLGRLGDLRVGDEEAAKQLGADVAAWLTRAAM